MSTNPMGPRPVERSNPDLRKHAFRLGCVVWVVLAVAFWLWVYRSAGDFVARLSASSGTSVSYVAPESPQNRDLVIGDDLTVSGAEFGVIETDEDGALHFVATRKVDLEPGVLFGWIVWLETSRPRVRWREEFRSASPENWSYEDDGSHSLSADGSTMTREIEVVPNDGRIDHFWQITEGDRPGPQRTRVFVEEVPVGDFEFEVR